MAKQPKINREELAWAGGFFTGEGSTGCYKNHKTGKLLRISVFQVELEPLERFKKSLNDLGHINGPYKRNSRYNAQPIYSLQIRKFVEVQAAIAMLWPWLSSTKQEQAEKALLEMKEYHESKTQDSIL